MALQLTTSFMIKDLAFSTEYVRSAKRIRLADRRDITQSGGRRLQAKSNQHVRIPDSLISVVSDDVIEVLPKIFDIPPILPLFQDASGHFDGIIDKFLEENDKAEIADDDDLGIAYIRAVYNFPPEFSEDEVDLLKENLRPADELTHEQINDHAIVQKAIADASSRDRQNLEIIVSCVNVLIATDKTIATHFGINPDADADTIAAGNAIETREVANANPSTLEVVYTLMVNKNSTEMVKTAMEEVILSRCVATGQSHKVITSCSALVDAVAQVKAQHRANSFKAPQFMEDIVPDDSYKFYYGEIKVNGNKSKTSIQRLKELEATRRRLTRQSKKTRTKGKQPKKSGADDDSTVLSGNESGEDGGDESRSQDTTVGGSLFAIADGNATESTGTPFVMGDNEETRRRITLREKEVNFDDGGDAGSHFLLSAFGAIQLENDRNPMQFGYARAEVVYRGLYRDSDEVNRINNTDFIKLNVSVADVNAYHECSNNHNEFAVAEHTTLVSRLKSGHVAQADNLLNTFVKLANAVDCRIGTDQSACNEFMNLVVYYGYHCGSFRIMLALAYMEAAKGNMSSAFTKRLVQDGPGLSSAYNLERIIEKIAEARFFELTHLEERIKTFRMSMARIKEIGYRCLPYSSYLYGVEAPLPEYHLGVVNSFGSYAGAFGQVLTNSTIMQSAAVRRAVKDSAANDIATEITVVAFIKAYRTYIGGLVQAKLRAETKAEERKLLTNE
jgi:hypothetical protein